MTAPTLHTSTRPSEIRAVLDRVVATDPVRATVLGTIALGLTASAWAAWRHDDAGAVAAVAARSEADYPVAISGAWDTEQLVDALAALPELLGVSGAPELVEAVVAALGRAPRTREEQVLHRLDEVVVPAVAGAPLRAGEVHRHLVREWFVAFGHEVHDVGPDLGALADRVLDAGDCWLWADPDGTPVALAARRPVIAGSARIGPVYTPPAQRGRGWASALTAALSSMILAERAVPVLFTDLANPTSNKIYRAIGYRPVEHRVVVTFRR